MLFIVPDDYAKELVKTKKEGSGYKIVDEQILVRSSAIWCKNLSHKKRTEDLLLFRTYNAKDYPKYDNYDAINVDKVKDIPMDYYGVMGVPITFLDSYNPNQFEIVGAMTTTKVEGDNYGYPYINGDRKYARILIKRKQNNADNA